MDLKDLGFADITPAPKKTIHDEYINEHLKISKMLRNKEITHEEYVEMRVTLVEKYIVMIPDLTFIMPKFQLFRKFLEENESIRKRIEKINNRG
jgi:hypothetical protein